MPSSSRGHFRIFDLSSEALQHYASELGFSNNATALAALAGSLAAAARAEGCRGKVVGRCGARPVLGFLEDSMDGPNAHAGRRFALQAPRALASARRLRYVGHARAHADCERLAARLLETLGRREIERARFAAVPRGGLVVLGLLASRLGLLAEQLEPGFALEDGYLVAVDDCVLSGARCGEFLARSGAERVIFAHLYSPPPVREAIERRESRVIACVAAQDLEVFSVPEREAPAVGEGSSVRYWQGATETLCFPWNEPDRTIFDPETGTWQKAWPIVPPELCLKNRPASSVEPLPVQIQPEARGPVQPTERVVFGDFGEEIILADIEGGRVLALTDSGAAMWRAMVEHGTVDGIVAALAEEYEASRDELRSDAEGFLAALSERGLVES